jgi:hypothetical protein
VKDITYTRGITIADASCRHACDTGGLRPQFGYVELRARSTVGTNGHWAVVVRREPSGDTLPEGESILVPEAVLRHAIPALRKAGHNGGIVARTEADANGTYEAKLILSENFAEVSWTVPGGIHFPDFGAILRAKPAEEVGSPCALLRLNFGYLADIYRAAKEAQNGGNVVGVSILPTGGSSELARRSMVVFAGPADWYAVLMPLSDGPKDGSIDEELSGTRASYAAVRASVLPLEAKSPSPVELAKALAVDPGDVPATAEPEAHATETAAEPEPHPEPAPKTRRAASPRPKSARKPRASAPAPSPEPPAPCPPAPVADGVTLSRWAM